jgi:hypothetical protein
MVGGEPQARPGQRQRGDRERDGDGIAQELDPSNGSCHPLRHAPGHDVTAATEPPEGRTDRSAGWLRHQSAKALRT